MDNTKWRAKKTRTLGAAGTLLAILSIAAAGCSSSSSSAAATGSAPAGSAPAGSVVNLGIIAPEGTAVFNLPESVASAQAGVNALNARGGLGGHKVNLVYCNDMGDPSTTMTCAREMVNDKVLAVIGGGVLNPTIIPPILNAAGIPWIGDDAQSSVEFNSPNMFLFGAGESTGYAVLSAWDGKSKVPSSLTYADVPSGQTIASGLNQSATAGGLAFKAVVSVPPDAADFAPIVAAAKVSQVKALVMVVGATQAAQLIQAVQAGGSSVLYQWASEPQADIVSALGSGATFDFASPFPALTTKSANPLVVQYLSELKTLADTGNSDAAAAYKNPASTGIQSWLAIQAIVALVKDGSLKSYTSSALMSALKTAKNVNLDGIIPAWTPNAAGPAGQVRVSNPYYYINQYKDGTVTQLTPKAVTLQQVLAGAPMPTPSS
jgi:branched-chain amino acid transport system substrate-binding protein